LAVDGSSCRSNILVMGMKQQILHLCETIKTLCCITQILCEIVFVMIEAFEYYDTITSVKVGTSWVLSLV
jgi:hypothetical protein